MGDAAVAQALSYAAGVTLSDFRLFEAEERYGALQWVWVRESGTRRDCVIVAEMPDSTRPTIINIEISAAAERDGRYGRAVVAELHLPWSRQWVDLVTPLQDALEKARKHSEAIDPTTLTGTYLRPGR